MTEATTEPSGRCPRITSQPPRAKTAADGRQIAEFLEKPKDTTGIALPGHPDQIFASMGNYCFTTSALLDLVSAEWLDRLAIEAAARRLPEMEDRKPAEALDRIP